MFERGGGWAVWWNECTAEDGKYVLKNNGVEITPHQQNQDGSDERILQV